MKKIQCGLIAFALLFNSCSGPDSPPINISPALSDGAAWMEAYLSLSSSCPAALTPAGQGGVAAVATIKAAQASGLFGRASSTQNTSGKQSNFLLSPSLIIASNPFEIVGSNHNKILNYLNFTGDSLFSYSSRIENYEDETWLELIEVSENNLNSQEKVSAISCARNSNVVNDLQQRNIIISGNPGDFDPNSVIQQSQMSSASKIEMQAIVTGYTDRYIQNSNNIDAIEFLNAEIQKRLKAKGSYSVEEEAILGFLSIVKHSTYYWSN